MSRSSTPLLAISAIIALTPAVAARPAAAQCNATQLCPPNADPCRVAAACTVPSGAVFDLGDRALVLAGKTLTVGHGDGGLTIRAGSILLEPGSRIVASGVGGPFGIGDYVQLESRSTITVQSRGTSRSRIVTNGALEAGGVDLIAEDDIVFDGAIQANAGSPDGEGGQIDLSSNAGSITIRGPGLEATGGHRGEDGAACGSIVLGAFDDIVVDSPLEASNGDCFDGIDIFSANGEIVTNDVLDVDASGDYGDGGAVLLTARNAVTVNGPIRGNARGSGGPEDGAGGIGGFIAMTAEAITVNAAIDVDGSGPDGFAGSVDLFAVEGSLAVHGRITARHDGALGLGGVVALVADGSVLTTETIDVTGRFAGGDVEITAALVGDVSVGSDVIADGGLVGGLVEMAGCDVELQPKARISVLGSGDAYPRATARLEASGSMTVRGDIRAGAGVELVHRGVPPFISGTAAITPDPTIVYDPYLPCCLCGDAGDDTPIM